MKKSHLILFIGGALVAIGMVLSYTGASFVSGQVMIKEAMSNSTTSVTLEKEFDSSVANKGAYVVRAEGFEKAGLVATLYNSQGEEIASKKIAQISTEEYFDIGAKGVYKLEVRNSGEEIPIVLGLTYMPDRSLIVLNILGQSMIITGFVGVVVAGIYALVKRKKSS